VPSLEEQKIIVTQLDNIVGKLDTIINELGNSNSIFTQYRQTLIENAVRGKIKFI
jgi:restriction endonuclease S subunit